MNEESYFISRPEAINSDLASSRILSDQPIKKNMFQ